ncbi:hypothetical protein BHM03_00005707 [Ensete ventricosum]|nr:hypothetical protein BHM03_00005707 [Ensete ventricosum]
MSPSRTWERQNALKHVTDADQAIADYHSHQQCSVGARHGRLRDEHSANTLVKAVVCCRNVSEKLLNWRNNSQEAFQMEIQVARMVQAAKLLRNLVSELKQTTIFSGFGSLNENVNRRIAEFNRLEEKHKFPPHVR